MKLLKKIFIIISSVIIAGCLFIVLCAFFPSLSDALAEGLYGTEELPLTDTDAGSLRSQSDGNASDMNNEGQSEGKNSAVLETIQGSQGTKPGTQTAGAEGTKPGTQGEGPQESDALSQEQDKSVTAKQTYIAPEENAVQTPADVSGKNGYKPVQGDAERIESEDTQADVGETGEDLDFDTLMYPYYGMLDEDMKKIYRQIYANAQAVNRNFSPVIPVSLNRLKTVFEAVYNDHPELFWLDTEYACQYLKNGDCSLISLQFNQAAEDLETSRNAFDKAAERILYTAGLNEDDYEKEKSVHNALIERIDYNLAAPMNQSAYSALVDGQTVCAGYARAFQYLMQKLGIPCYYCTGYSGQNHAWNIVKLGEDYYNVDVTWDDTRPATYTYFNKSDADYASTHMRKSLSVYLPACEGGIYSNREAEAPLIAGQEPAEQTGSGQGNDEGLNDSSGLFLHTLAYYGFSEDDMLTDIDSYYKACNDYLLHAGLGTVEFDLVIPYSMWETLLDAYGSRDYEKGYMNDLLLELEASYCNYLLHGEILQDDYCLIRHAFAVE